MLVRKQYAALSSSPPVQAPPPHNPDLTWLTFSEEKKLEGKGFSVVYPSQLLIGEPVMRFGLAGRECLRTLLLAAEMR